LVERDLLDQLHHVLSYYLHDRRSRLVQFQLKRSSNVLGYRVRCRVHIQAYFATEEVRRVDVPEH